MELDDIKQILDLMREHELSEFELERDGLKVRVKKGGGAITPVVLPAPPGPPQAVPAIAPSAHNPAPSISSGGPISEPVPAPGEAMELAVVKSPIVGTFYRSSEPGAAPFADVGAFVKKGQVLCIIEAMKLMNEIDSEYEGEVVKVYVENGQPVQYGERLFAIRTAGEPE